MRPGPDGAIGRRPAIALIPLLAAVGLACDGPPGGDGDGRGDADSVPRRIVSLIPAATELILALGVGDRLVARTRYDTDTTLTHLPAIEGGLHPSLERLVAFEPDLVIPWPDNTTRSVQARLQNLGIRVYAPDVQSMADMEATIRDLGRILDRQQAADSLIAAIDREFRETRDRVADRTRPDVFYVVWHDPPTTTSDGTFVHELIESAGGRNIFADAPGLWPQVSLEEIVDRDPDVIVISQSDDAAIDLDRLFNAPGWRELRAGASPARVVEVDAELFNRWGPGLPQAARRLARRLHPEAFPGPPDGPARDGNGDPRGR